MKTHVIVYFIVVYAAICDSALTKLTEHELTSMEGCNLPKEEYEAVPIQYGVRVVTVKNKKTIEMNMTVVKKTSPLFTTMRVYKSVKNETIVDHVVSNLSCKYPLVSILWRLLRLKHDKNCCILPGFIVINHPNMDIFLNNPSKIGTLPAGTYIYDFQLQSKRGVMLCLTSRVEDVKH